MARAKTKSVPDRHAFGAALREARRVAGLTQVDLAAAVPTKQTNVSSWETGERMPREFGLVFEIERLLDVAPGSLSRHLGFLPVEAANGKSSVTAVQAIRSDPALDETAKRALSAAYASFTGQR